MLRGECDRRREVGCEVVGALPGDAVDEVEREVVEPRLPKRAEGGAHGLGPGPALEDVEQVRLEALRAERHAVDAVLAQQRGQRRGDRLRVRLDGQLLRRRQRGEQPCEVGRLREGRRAAAEEDRLGGRREQVALRRELLEHRVDVGPVLPPSAEDGDEVAVAAPVGAERQVDVEVLRERGRWSSPPRGRREAPYRNATGGLVTGVQRLRADFVPIVLDPAHRSASRFRTARKASCGTSTPPTCFMRFLPFFCFSSSLRLRLMSPP